jgi:hypothetical protein
VATIQSAGRRVYLFDGSTFFVRNRFQARPFSSSPIRFRDLADGSTGLLVCSGMIVGLHVMAIKSVDGQVPRVEDLFRSLALGPAYLLALALYCAAVGVGFALLIVPGIYLAIRYCLFAQIITDKSAGALAALRGAAELARGNWSQLGVLFFVAFLLNMAGAAILGLGLVISFPVSLLAIAGFYRSLRPTIA